MLLSEHILPCEPQGDSLHSNWAATPLRWQPYVSLAIVTADGNPVFDCPDHSYTSDRLAEWLHSLSVHVFDGDLTHTYVLGLEKDQETFSRVLTQMAKENRACLVLDVAAQRHVQWLLFALPGADPDDLLWRPYWLEEPERPFVPADARDWSSDRKGYYAVVPTLSRHVYTMSKMLDELFTLPWKGAPVSPHTLHAFVAGSPFWPPAASVGAGDGGAVKADTCARLLHAAAEFSLSRLNRSRTAHDVRAGRRIPWLPRPLPWATQLSKASVPAWSCLASLAQPSSEMSEDAWKSLITVLVTFSARRQETELRNTVLRAGLVFTPGEGLKRLEPEPGRDVRAFSAQLATLMMAAESVVDSKTKLAMEPKRDAHSEYCFQALQGDADMSLRPGQKNGITFSVNQKALQNYLAALEQSDASALPYPAMTLKSGTHDATLPTVLVPVVSDTAPCVCFGILEAFLTNALWKCPAGEPVFMPYLRGDWRGVRNTLGQTKSLLLNTDAHELTAEQRRAVENVYQKDNALTVLWGPPGTGKTATLARIIADMFASERRSLRVLVIANTKKALDVLHEKVATRLNRADVHVACLTDDNNNDAVNDVPKGDESADGGSVLVLCTVFKSYTQLLAKGRCSFDVLVVDEASMLPASYLVLAGQLLKPKVHKVILSGDLLQLQPIQEDYAGNAVFSMMFPQQKHWMGSALQALFGPPGEPGKQLDDLSRLNAMCGSASGLQLPAHVVQLNVCFRSLGKIVRLFADLYPSTLHCGPQDRDEMSGQVQKVILGPGDSEAQAVLQVLRQCGQDTKKLVVTPHRRQRYDIRRVLRDHDLGEVLVDTTERTQGTEADCVVLCYGPSVRVDTDFAYQLFRMNVAVSRAVSRVVLIVCPEKARLLRDTPDGRTPFRTFVSEGRDLSPAMASIGWHLLRRTFLCAEEMKLAAQS